MMYSMRKFVGTCLGLLGFCLTLSAQTYKGPATLGIQSEGSAEITTLTSKQAVVQWSAETSTLTVLLKMHALYPQASEAGQAILREVLLVDANPLLRISVDMAAVDPGDRFTQVHVLPARFQLGGEEAKATAEVQVVRGKEQDQLRVELTATLKGAALGIGVPASYRARFSDQLTISVQDGNLTRRY